MNKGIRPDFVDRSAHFWSRRLGRSVSREDARQMIENMVDAFRLLDKWDLRTREHMRFLIGFRDCVFSVPYERPITTVAWILI